MRVWNMFANPDRIIGTVFRCFFYFIAVLIVTSLACSVCRAIPPGLLLLLPPVSIAAYCIRERRRPARAIDHRSRQGERSPALSRR